MHAHNVGAGEEEHLVGEDKDVLLAVEARCWLHILFAGLCFPFQVCGVFFPPRSFPTLFLPVARSQVKPRAAKKTLDVEC